MDRHHALQHLYELRARVAFLRAMRPDNQSYKLWIGDVAEFANAVWGTGTTQLEQLAAALRQPASGIGSEDEARQRYLDRLSGVDAVLARYEEEIAGPAAGSEA